MSHSGKSLSEKRMTSLIPWPDYVSFGEVVYPPGGNLGPRIQPTFELVIVYSGEMKVWIDGKRYEMGANHICLLFPGHEERFAFAEREETWHSYSHIDFAPQSEFMQRVNDMPWSIPLSLRMKSLIRAGIDLKNANLSTVEELQKSLALEMLWQFIGEAEQGTHHPRTAQAGTLDDACQYIRIHLNQPLSLDQIAGQVALSSSQLNRIFKVSLGVSPMEYVWRLRVERAVELLHYTGLPIGLIADRCGFQTQNHFSRRVRELTGFAPKEIRKRSHL